MDVGASKMEAVSRIVYRVFLTGSFLGLAACASRTILEKETGQFDDIQKEYDRVVRVQEIAPVIESKSEAKEVTAKTKKKSENLAPAKVTKKLKPHEPKIEDGENFDGRRPLVDPFTEGEETVLSVEYMGMSAGDLIMRVEPMKMVNNRKAYHFTLRLTSNRKFSMFYAVNNFAETFMDFETMLPITLNIENNESARLVQSKTFFDQKKNEASMWEKRVTKKDGEKKKEIRWPIEPYSQSTISSMFYLRAFTLRPGKKFAFRVAVDGKNVIFKGEILRRESLETEVGTYNAVVVKPEIHLDGHLKPTGDILFWLSDDDKKHILKIEAKVKVGTLHGKIKKLSQ
jgi:hypothetical protein